MPDADAGAFARDDLAEGGQVAAQGVGVFVVHVLSVHLAKVTATVSLDHSIEYAVSGIEYKRRDTRWLILKRNVFDADFLVSNAVVDGRGGRAQLGSGRLVGGGRR